jgi:hypothetical protein
MLILLAPPQYDYVKLDTREATHDATLAQYMPDITWGDWYVIGPFDNDGRDKHDVVYPPELGIDLNETYNGKGGRRVTWEHLDDAEWDLIPLDRYDSDEANNDSIVYLYREGIAAADGTLTVNTGSDDGLKLWFNGQLLLDADFYRGFDPDAHTLTLPVRAGPNTLLVKVTQGEGGWDFQLRPQVDSRLLAWLQYHLERDFPTSPESAYYRILTVLEPQDVVLEVGGLAMLPDGRPVVSTRRGDVWLVENAYEDPPFNANFQRFAFGLHEPLGAQWRDDGLLVVQRGEVTRLLDTDGDDRADLYESVSEPWGLSGNYHEFAFGPEFDGQGRMWVTLNLGFCGALGKSIVPWRGWALIIDEDGALQPVCGGLRSPNGLGSNAAGDMFYTDNQGDWVGTNKLSHMEFGDWHGHPASSNWYVQAGLEPPSGETDFKRPAIWFPYDRMGRSASDIVLDDTDGRFGPFTGQLFVGDQYSAQIMRVYLEQVDGVYQGACFPFRSGFDSGINRLCFAPDGSLFVGLTNRGWPSLGRRPWGLQRVVYTGKPPFEILQVRANHDGFTLRFTKPVNAISAGRLSSYTLASFTYERWERYGSPEIDREEHAITAVEVSDDRMEVRLRTGGLRETYVHELYLPGVRSADDEPLLHEDAYYTLNVIPDDA